MPSLLKKLQGDLYLGYRAIIAHPLRLLFDRDERPGKQRFLANYAPEGNLPTTVEDRRVLAGASRCIHCGLCEPFDQMLTQLPRTQYDGASLLPMVYARAMPGLQHAREAIQAIDPEKLARSEAVCPTRVPLRSIARWLKVKLAELDHETHAAQTATK